MMSHWCIGLQIQRKTENTIEIYKPVNFRILLKSSAIFDKEAFSRLKRIKSDKYPLLLIANKQHKKYEVKAMSTGFFLSLIKAQLSFY